MGAEGSLLWLRSDFVKSFEKYLNPLHLAMFALDVSKQYPGLWWF